MSTTLQWTAEGATVVLEIDVTPTEGYESSAEVTKHPVDQGGAISDHVRANPDTLSIEGVISNTPVRIPASQTRGLTRAAANVDVRVGREAVQVQLQQWSGALDRVRDCDALFAGLVGSGTLLTLTTSLRTVQNLVLVRYRVDRTADTGNALPVTLDLERVRIVSTARAAVPALRNLRVPENRGAVAPVPVGSGLDRATNAYAGREMVPGYNLANPFSLGGS